MKDPFASGVRGQESVRQDLQFETVECTAAEDKARQEYGVQSDIGYQIQKFGVGHPLTFGEQDFNLMDLTTAMRLVDESRDAWLRLPKVVRDRYQSWANVERAAATGELEQVLKAAGASAAVADVLAASPSDSAADDKPKP